MDKNKRLIISRTIPFPVKGGDLIVLENIIRALSESGFKFDLLCFNRLGETPEPSKNNFENIYSCSIEPKINLRCLTDWIFKNKSYIFNRFYSKKLSEKLLNLVKTGEYSTLVFEHAYMYTNLLFNPELIQEIRKRNIKTIINAHVLESLVFEQNTNQENYNFSMPFPFNFPEKLLKFFRRKELNFLKKIELECIKNADSTVFLAKEELERVENILPEKLEKLKLLEFTPFINNYPYSKPEFEDKNSIYFLGTFSWIQNSDAVKYFVNKIFPLILKQNPEIKFYLVGMNAKEDIKSLHDGKSIFFVGEVKDVFEEIKKYSVLVLPLRIKGGTRIKIIESLCWGKAIITTSAGLEGINTENDNPVIIADTPENFAQKVLELLSDEELKIKTKEHARTFAEKYYSFEKFKNNVVGIFS